MPMPGVTMAVAQLRVLAEPGGVLDTLAAQGYDLAGARMADSTRAMRKSIVDRDILPAFQNRLLNEITADDLRALCGKVKGRGAPATAVHIRDIVKQVYAFAILHGEKVDNPAADVGAASIATFVPTPSVLEASSGFV